MDLGLGFIDWRAMGGMIFTAIVGIFIGGCLVLMHFQPEDRARAFARYKFWRK